MKPARSAFTLLEVALVLAVASVLLAAVAPVAIRQVELRLAQKAGREITQIQDAARLFYADRGRWPQGVADLQASSYLNPAWSGLSPWQTPYVLQIVNQTPSVSVAVPAELEPVMRETTATLPTKYTTEGTK